MQLSFPYSTGYMQSTISWICDSSRFFMKSLSKMASLIRSLDLEMRWNRMRPSLHKPWHVQTQIHMALVFLRCRKTWWEWHEMYHAAHSLAEIRILSKIQWMLNVDQFNRQACCVCQRQLKSHAKCTGAFQKTYPHFKDVKARHFYSLQTLEQVNKKKNPCLMEADCFHSGEHFWKPNWPSDCRDIRALHK